VSSIVNSIGLFGESKSAVSLWANVGRVGLWFGLVMPFDGRVESADFWLSDVPKKESAFELEVGGRALGEVTFQALVPEGTIIKQVFPRGIGVFTKGDTIQLITKKATTTVGKRTTCSVVAILVDKNR